MGWDGQTCHSSLVIFVAFEVFNQVCCLPRKVEDYLRNETLDHFLFFYVQKPLFFL